MKIAIIDDSCMQTRVSVAEQDDEHTIEITDAEWAEFNDVEERYESMLGDFKMRQLAQRQMAVAEIAQLRARLSQLEARLGVAPTPAPVAAAPAAPIDETDAGMGGRAEPWMGSMSTADLRDAHAELRQRTAEKRLKLR
jgi:hypothetical protein